MISSGKTKKSCNKKRGVPKTCARSNRKNRPEILKAVDFFCGGGGMSLGISNSGIRVVAGIDVEESCRETYEKNHSRSKFILGDIEHFPTKKLMDEYGVEKNDDYMIFIGCSPCQYWTRLHTQKNSHKQGKELMGQFHRFVRYYRPGFVVVENVPGIIDSEKYKKFSRWLSRHGYEFSAAVIDTNQYGVPQRRKRFVLIASRVSLAPSLRKSGTQPTVRDVIGPWNGFPKIAAGTIDHSDFMHTASNLEDKCLKRLRITPKDGGTRAAWSNAPDLQINTYKNRDQKFGFKDVYGRMAWDSPAPTITTRFNSLSNGRFGHPEENRAISLREGATLQTFPMDYVFMTKSKSAAAKIIGNAVPPALARRIGAAITRAARKAGM